MLPHLVEAEYIADYRIRLRFAERGRLRARISTGQAADRGV